jgi:cell division protein FtsW
MAKTNARGGSVRAKASPKAAPKAAERANRLSEATSSFFKNFFRAQSREFYLLIGLVIFIVGVGLLMVLSASFVDSLRANNNAFSIFNKQFISSIVGFVMLFVLATLPIEFIKRMVIPATAIALAVQLAVLLIGTSVNGNKNWINIFGFTVQPSEFLKLLGIVYAAKFLYERQDEFDDPRRVWFPLVAIAGLFIIPVVAGGDVGTGIVMAAVFFAIWASAGLPRRLINVYAIGAALAVPLIMISNSSRRGRIMAWLDPSAADPNDYNWQTTHGIWAFAAGGLQGVGLGQSKLKWSWIPEAENDFIFAIIGEETGLIGALALIILFIFLTIVMIRIAFRTRDLYRRMVVLGVMFWISIQAFINIAVVLTLLPVLGVPLPLISAGGSSLLATLMAFGVVLGIERENHALGAVTSRRSRR